MLTVYFISIYVCAGMGMERALDNPTYLHMGSWFHYAKLYAATAGCIGFMMLKYGRGMLRRSEAFKVFPFAIIALTVNIAAFGYIMYRAKKLGVNPYKHEAFKGTRDFERAMSRTAQPIGQSSIAPPTPFRQAETEQAPPGLPFQMGPSPC